MQASHKEAAARRVKRDEEDVKKMMGCFSSGLMTDPFTHDSDELLSIAIGVVLPEDVAQSLVRSTEKSRQQMNAFVEKRINSFPSRVVFPDVEVGNHSATCDVIIFDVTRLF